MRPLTSRGLFGFGLTYPPHIVQVRLGEKDVLQLAQKAVVELLRKLREGEPIG